ncbi:MAG: hypothetical protein Q9P14_05340 [candidate division KSB1 bacterium]|nr:hypothetical protein [candidate division KSB1 bacterium]
MLEKIHGDKVNAQKSIIIQSKRLAAVTLAAGLVLWASDDAGAQIRAGGGFLKLIPGARQQGIHSSLTGNLDNMYAVYANPGATGLLREWQWSLSYTRWIPDMFVSSVFWGSRIRTPWSAHTRLSLSGTYLGIPDFDSSNGRTAAASGGDLLISASLGQSLTGINRRLSLGVSAKFLRSNLNSVNDHTFVFDAGLLFRTQRMRFFERTGRFSG